MAILLALAAAPASRAQGPPQLKRPGNTPEEKPPEIKKPKKPIKGPRAVAVLEFNGNKATLIPVAILVEGKFYDASAYKADPVPMALEGGTVYEAEQTGASQGLFTIGGALHSKTPDATIPWMATGSYLANGAEAPKTRLRAEDKPTGLDNDSDAPPRLTRGTGSKAADAPVQDSTPVGSSGSTASGGGNGSSNKAGSPDKANQPEKAGASTTPTSPAQASGSPGSSASGSDTAKAAPASAAGKSPSANSNDQTSPGATDNYYRPTLRRGKPTEAAPDEPVGTISTTAKGAASATEAEAAAASKEPEKLVPAISDAGGPEPHSYVYFWKEGEEDDRRKQMQTLAENEIRSYVNDRAKGAISAVPAPAPAKSATRARKPAAKPVQVIFDKFAFRTFDAWVNNQPVMVVTGEAHLAAPPVAPLGAVPDSYSITLVARTDIYGSLRKLFSGVTDKYHLDVTPRLELIDVVDADGDGRGELLFRETSDAGSGYVIYRPTADKLWKVFDSLAEK